MVLNTVLAKLFSKLCHKQNFLKMLFTIWQIFKTNIFRRGLSDRRSNTKEYFGTNMKGGSLVKTYVNNMSIEVP